MREGSGGNVVLVNLLPNFIRVCSTPGKSCNFD